MPVHRVQLNGMTREQWDRLAALAESSGITRTAYIRRCLESVVDEGYVPLFTYIKQPCRIRPKQTHRYYPGHWVYVEWGTTYNLVVTMNPRFLDDLDEVRRRYGVKTRHEFVYQCVAWHLDIQHVWENQHDRVQKSY